METLFFGGTMTDNKRAKYELIREYGEQCFLLGKIEKRNPLTYHHIVPRRSGKARTDFYNGALLCLLEHNMFNTIESYNQNYADDLNWGFQEYKRSKEYRLLIEMRLFVEQELFNRGYEVEEKSKILTLKRRHDH